MTAQERGAGAGRRAAPKGITTRSLSSAAEHGQRTAELLDRSPPIDRWAERAVVASPLMDPSILPDVAALLDVDHLADPVCRAVYGAMLRLHAERSPADPTLIAGVLADGMLLDDPPSGDDDRRPVMVADLHALLYLVPWAGHWRYYVQRVLTVARRRLARERGVSLIRAAHAVDDHPQHVSPAIRRATEHAIAHRARQRQKGGAA